MHRSSLLANSFFALSVLVLAGCVQFLSLGTARADPADQARYYDAEAREHFQKGDYRAALDDFFAAQALTPSATLAFNIATCFQQLGDHQAAYTYFTESLELGGLPETFQATARTSLSRLAAKVARLSVVSRPEGALVYIDDESHGDYGKTPREIAVDPGTHRVWVTLPGYLPAAAEVEAKLGSSVQVSLVPQQITGTLTVDGTLPQGTSGAALVQVMSHEGKLVAEGAFPFRKGIPPDNYRIVVSGGGLQPWSSSAVVEPDQEVALTAELALMPRATGDISAVSTVAGSIVALDGVQMGVAPLVIPNVVVGDHELTITSPDGPSVTGSVPVAEQRRTWATATYDLQRTVSPITYWVAGAGLLAVGIGSSLLIASYGMYDRGDLAGKDYQTAAVATLIGGAVTLSAATILYLATGKKMPVAGELTFRTPE